jgi:hypothetical protein
MLWMLIEAPVLETAVRRLRHWIGVLSRLAR